MINFIYGDLKNILFAIEKTCFILSYLHKFKMAAHEYHMLADLIRLCTVTCRQMIQNLDCP